MIFGVFLTIIPIVYGDNIQCITQGQGISKYVKGSYNNILQFYKGGLLSSARSNSLWGGKFGCTISDEIYLTGTNLANTYCTKPCFIKLQFLQIYYINTIKFRMFDQNGRTYDLQVYVGNNGTETLVYSNTALVGPITVTFQELLVEYIRFVNINGNNQGGDMSIVKVIAYYKF